MRRVTTRYLTFSLILSFIIAATPVTGEGAKRNSPEQSRNSANAQVAASDKAAQTPSRVCRKRSRKNVRRKVAVSHRVRKSQRLTPVYQPQRQVNGRISHAVYARTLGDIQGPLPEVISSEIAKLRDTHHLLNSDDISVYIHDLTRDETMVSIKSDQVRNAASLIKPFVMLTVYDMAHQNKLSLTDAIENQIYKMITISHNESTNSLIRLVGGGDVRKGLQQINSTIRKYGFTDTHLVESIPEGGKTYLNRTSAHDMSEFFKKIYRHCLVTPYYSQKMIDVLLDNKVHRIETQTLVQDRVPVADKTGYVRGTNGDCGIVFLRNINRQASDYVVSIIIENPYRPLDGWGKQKTAVIRHLSNLIYSYFRLQFQTARTSHASPVSG
ncbi:MAG: class A beta-lactamase-related serine hydrolase [Proteobacteria bacterium]|nr:class A beta-lactamase-related serine hydrolase [Pseudomonadota bacterium]